MKNLLFILAFFVCYTAFSCSDDSEGPKEVVQPDTNKEPDERPDQVINYIPTKPVTDEVLTDSALLDLIQSQTLKYFTDFQEPNSGMARERNTSGELVTTGGTGFGMMALIVGTERGWISRENAVAQTLKILNRLRTADRFHGAWSHWLNGRTGKAIAFSTKDNGGDLVETAFLVQGMLAAKAYFSQDNKEEQKLRDLSTELWEGVEWDWYTRGGQNKLYWHWSEDYAWDMNMPISGWNESLIVYVLAASSPTHPISKKVYDEGWTRKGSFVNNATYYNIKLPFGPAYGGPLFFAHYSFMGLDPRRISDGYANYFEQNKAHSRINYEYCVHNPYKHDGYSENFWGLTASDEKGGYSAHAPLNKYGKDNGTVTPTAALGSMPYTPTESLKAARGFYFYLKDKLWGKYGFYDAFNPSLKWTANSYLAIDQGPIVVMIENYRSQLLWKHFMKNQDIIKGLEKLGFTIN